MAKRSLIESFLSCEINTIENTTLREDTQLKEEGLFYSVYIDTRALKNEMSSHACMSDNYYSFFNKEQ